MSDNFVSEREEWAALAEGESLHKLPPEALIASTKYLAKRLLDLTESPYANSLHGDLRHVLNKHSVENGANIPDNLLATYLIESLKALNTVTRRRDSFFGISVFPATDGPVKGNEDGIEEGVVVIDEAAEGTEE